MPAQTLTGHAMLEGVSMALRNRRIDLSIHYLGEDHHPLPPALENTKVDGLLLQGPPLSPALAQRLGGLPAVWLLYSGSHDFGDRVQPDHRGVGKLALQHLRERGPAPHCCMTYRARRDRFDYWTERSDAFEQMGQLLEVDHILLGHELEPCITDQDRLAAARLLVDRFMALDPRPRGLFLAMNDLGCFVVDELHRRGVRIMQDVWLVAGDSESAYRPIQPIPVTVDIRSADIGRLAVNLLLTRIANPGLPRTTQIVEPNLLIP